MDKRTADHPSFIGIDLAWSPRNRSGGAVIKNGRLVASCGDLDNLHEVCAFIGDHLSTVHGTVVAIDAPLRVPNITGTRTCERELNAEWARFQAGAYPANRKLVSIEGVVRGEALVEMLVWQHRFTLTSSIPRRSTDRLLCEIYPRPAHISLFDLDRTIKYKRGRVADRRQGLSRYQEQLRTLRNAKPSLKKTKDLLEGTDVATLRGRNLKAHEDRLDAIACAYIAYYLWWHGPQRARVYGTLADGHIIVPITPAMSLRLDRKS